MHQSLRYCAFATGLVATLLSISAGAATSVPVTVTNTTPVPVTVTGTPLPVTTNPIPANAFFGRIDGNGANQLMGAVGTAIGVTSILITNETAQSQLLTFFNASAVDPTLCPNGTAVVLGGASPFTYLLAEANKTTQFTFPTPLVFNSVTGAGITCIGSNVPAGVQLFVSGVTQ